MRLSAVMAMDALRATAIAWVGVGLLVGNAYLANITSYPPILEFLGVFITVVSILFLVLPGLSLAGLEWLGFEFQLRGRESFISMNPWLWIYCAVFYSVFLFLILCYRRRRLRLKAERKTI